MRKWFGLLCNEYIKIFAKVSTVVVMIAVIAMSLLYYAVIAGVDFGVEYERPQMQETDYQKLIDQEKREKSPGWEMRAERHQFMLDQKISQHDDWRYEVVYEAYGQKANAEYTLDPAESTAAEKRAEELLRIAREKDWKAYLADQISIMKADENVEQGQKDILIWGMQYRIDNGIDPGLPGADISWKSAVVEQVMRQKTALAQMMKEPFFRRYQPEVTTLKEEIAIHTYRLDNDVQYYTKPDRSTGDLPSFEVAEISFWQAFASSDFLIPVVGVLMVIIAGSSVAAEFSSGTVKFLLINPVKRWKILVAKYAAVMSVAVLMLVIFYAVSALLSGLFFGFEQIGAPYLTVVDGAVKTGSGFLFVAKKYLLGSVSLFTMATVAFSISALIRNSALSIGIGVFSMLAGNVITDWLGWGLRADWARYILFANLNINAIAQRETPFLGQRISSALIVIAVYMVVFLLMAWDGFVKRDVKK